MGITGGPLSVGLPPGAGPTVLICSMVVPTHTRSLQQGCSIQRSINGACVTPGEAPSTCRQRRELA